MLTPDELDGLLDEVRLASLATLRDDRSVLLPPPDALLRRNLWR